MKKKHSKSSQRWLKEHFADIYVKQAQQMGYRSRAAFKLIELQEKDKIIKPGMVVVDLGAAPGGWSQLAAQWLQGKGQVFALDILPMDTLEGVDAIEGDFTSDAVLQALLTKLQGSSVDVVMSDMAPNISGVKAVDQPRAMYLSELALDFSLNVLKPNGTFLVKVFQGEGFDEYLKQARQHFKKVTIRKPKASRPRSTEVYLLGQEQRWRP